MLSKNLGKLSVLFFLTLLSIPVFSQKHKPQRFTKMVITYDTVVVYDTVYRTQPGTKIQPRPVPGLYRSCPEIIMPNKESESANNITDKNKNEQSGKKRRNIFDNIPAIRLGRSSLPYDWYLSAFFGPLKHSNTFGLKNKNYQEWKPELTEASDELWGSAFGLEVGLANKILRPALTIKITTLNEKPNLYKNATVADTIALNVQTGLLNDWTSDALPFVYNKLRFLEIPFMLNVAFSVKKMGISFGAGISPSILLGSSSTYYANTVEYENQTPQTTRHNSLARVHLNGSAEAKMLYYFKKDYYLFAKPYYSYSISKVYNHLFLDYSYTYWSFNFGIGYRFKTIPVAESIKLKKRRPPKLPKPQ